MFEFAKLKTWLEEELKKIHDKIDRALGIDTVETKPGTIALEDFAPVKDQPEPTPVETAPTTAPASEEATASQEANASEEHAPSDV